MKAKKLIVMVLLAVLATGTLLTSCKKETDDDNNNGQFSFRSTQDNSTAQNVFNRIDGQIGKAASYCGKSSLDTIIGCPVIYITPGGFTFPKTVTLDYGTECAGSDGVTRSGQIVCTITAPYIDSGCVITATLVNFSEKIGSTVYPITGTEVTTNMGHNGLGHYVFSVHTSNATITTPDGVISWESDRENEWVEGYNTWINPFDDVYKVTGTASGTDCSGAAFNVTITNALEVHLDCIYYITAGTFEIINPGYPTITVDYGTGTCDNIIYVTYNGTTYTYVIG